jgi:hypothetical protein
MPDLATIITSAAVATVISGGVTLLASWRQRSHETKMEKLADARALRDRKIERVWKGLNVVCEVALDLLEASNRIFASPANTLAEADRVQSEADKKLDPIRADLVLDGDTESLLRQVVRCSNDYRKLSDALREEQDRVEQHRDTRGMGERTSDAWQIVQKDAFEVLNEARKTLAEIEKPIGSEADIRVMPTDEYLTAAAAKALKKAREVLAE